MKWTRVNFRVKISVIKFKHIKSKVKKKKLIKKIKGQIRTKFQRNVEEQRNMEEQNKPVSEE